MEMNQEQAHVIGLATQGHNIMYARSGWDWKECYYYRSYVAFGRTRKERGSDKLYWYSCYTVLRQTQRISSTQGGYKDLKETV